MTVQDVKNSGATGLGALLTMLIMAATATQWMRATYYWWVGMEQWAGGWVTELPSPPIHARINKKKQGIYLTGDFETAGWEGDTKLLALADDGAVM